MRAKREARNMKVKKERETLLQQGAEARKEVATSEALQQVGSSAKVAKG